MKKAPFLVLVTTAVVAPLVVAVVAALTKDRWFPAGDMAQAELHMRGFFDRPPLVGAAGRIVSNEGFQGSHPGPSLWVAMLPVYLLGGRSSGALMAAAASVHAVSIGAILALALRRGGRILLVFTALVLVAILRSSGTDFMIEPWNPWLALLPFALFLFLLFEMLDPPGDRGSDMGRTTRHEMLVIGATIVVGSHCVQSHAGYALLVVPPIAVGITLVVVRKLRTLRLLDGVGNNREVAKIIGFAAATTFVMWLPPVIDQIRRVPGNVSILIQHFGSPDEPTLGLPKTLDVLSSQFNLFGPWLLGPKAPDSHIAQVFGCCLFLALFVAACVVSHRRGRPDQSRILVVLVGLALLAAVSLLRIFGPFYEYTVRWLWIMAGLCAATSAWILAEAIAERINVQGRSRLTWQSASAFALVCTIGMTSAQVVDRIRLPGATDSRILDGIIEDTTAALDKDKTYQIRFYDPYTLNATGFGLLLELERRGFDVKVDPEFAAAALPHRTAPMDRTDGVVWVVVGPTVELARLDPTLVELAYFNPRTVEEQRRSQQLLVEVERGLRAAGRDDLVESLTSPGASILFANPPLPEETAVLVRELIRMGQPTGIFAMPVGEVAQSLE